MKLEDTPIEEAKLDADEPNEALRASISDLKSDTEASAAPDWDKLQARIERESTPKKNNVVWIAVAATLAAAAAGALWMGKSPDDPATVATETTQAPPQQIVVASALLEGQAQINGANAVVGREVFANAHVTSESASAIFDRPNKVRWLLESDSAVSIEHAEGPLVLALEKGGAEAQVVPVPNGEAFAIDVTSAKGNVVRVAVHGTHLRVARVADHVIVDLTEGVISVGAPPKRGSTLGQLVTAPAHVELDIDNMASGGALDVHHDAASVRTPVTLSAQSKVTTNDTPAPKPESTAKPSPQPAITSPIATPKPAPTDTIVADSNIDERVSNTVRSFVRAQQGTNGVTVIPPKSVTLKLELSDDGYVRTVTFDPPLSPDVQKHISDTLFDPKQTRFVTPADHRVRVDVNIEAH